MRRNLVWGIVLWLVLMGASVALLLHPALLQYLFLLRVPILIGGLLVALPILANTLVKNLLQNLFVLHGACEFFAVTIVTLLAGMGVTFVTNTLLVDGVDRFNLPELGWVDGLLSYQWVFAFILGLSTFIITICLAIPEIKQSSPQKNALTEIGLGIGSGGLATALLFKFGHFFTTFLEGSREFKQAIASLILLLPESAQRGYLTENTGVLTAGHMSAIGFFAAVMVIYLPLFFYGMWLYKPDLIPPWCGFVSWVFDRLTQRRRKIFEIPALFYLLIILLLLVLLFGGLTFLLDFFRVPLLIVLIVISFVVYWLFNVNHYYELISSSPSQFSPDNLIEILNHRFQRWEANYAGAYPTHPRTLAIICPAGGGIQAAGWTARVLTGLYEHPDLGKPFMDTVGLISSVSGGSIGSMYFIDALDNGKLEEQFNSPPSGQFSGQFSGKAPNAVVRSATVDGLDAIGWGLAYPDLWRVIGLPFLSHPRLDRGVALEADWIRALSDATNPPTLASWSRSIAAGTIPIPVFNATIVEDGSRLTISPIRFQEDGEQQFKDFRRLYEAYDLRITTAARLSATFPYVSPICRNYPNVPQSNFHVADGGYFDNFGVFTAVQWLNDRVLRASATDTGATDQGATDHVGIDDASSQENPLNIQRVLLIEIRSFPEPENFKAEPPGRRGWLQKQWKNLRGEENLNTPGWKMTILGPLLTLFNVRNYTQAARNEVDIQGLKQQWKGKVDIHHHVIQFPLAEDLSPATPSCPLTAEQQEMMKQARLDEPPLSWKLTEKQKQAIELAWEVVKAGSIQDLVARWQQTHSP
ncbi:hypothetical protein [Egbenema bharatensis]|uniref:hypothetical protein n=1 Tax=Egbenema bharatensis TaxID=3463334 RepID=UPI003A838FA0